MLPSARLGVPCAVVLLLAPALATAADPFSAPAFTASAQELREAAASATPPDADVEVLLEEVRISIDAQHRRTTTRRVIFRALTREGATEWATLRIGYVPSRDARPRVRARVISALGGERQLDPATLTDVAAHGEPGEEDTFSEGRVVTGPLPAMEAGALVEREVTSREEKPYFEGGVSERLFLGTGSALRRLRVVIEAPAALPLRTNLLHLAAKPRTERSGGLQRFILEAGPLPEVAQFEPGSPADALLWPALEYSTGRSWAELAATYQKRVEEQLAGTDLPALARQAGAVGLAPDAAAAQALRWIHRQVRYTGVELGEAALVPRSPQEVLTRQYGDCKDLATLLVAVLRGAGHRAQVALLRTGFADVPAALPGLGLFDHAIVHLEGTGRWIDATSRVHLVGELPTMDQGRRALIASAKTTALVELPRSSSQENRSETVREVRLAESGPAALVQTARTWGELAARQRMELIDGKPDEVRAPFEAFAKSAFGSSSLDRFTSSDPEELRSPFEVQMEVEHAGIATSSGTGAELLIYGASVFKWVHDEARPGRDKDGKLEAPAHPRQSDLEVRLPYTAELRYRVLPPPGFVPAELPPKASLSAGAATLTFEATAGPDHAVTVRFRFELPGRLKPSEVTALRQLIATGPGMNDGIKLRFQLEPAAALARGAIREGLSGYEALAAAHPGEALHQIQLANALLAAGFGEEARAHAERAVALEPKNANAHATLGRVLEHDPLGRRFKPPFDRARALAELRAAKALDPKQSWTRVSIAAVLEVGTDGNLNSPTAQPVEAAKELRALHDELDNHDYDDTLLIALWRTGDFAAAEALAATIAPGKVRSELWIAAIAARSLPAALAKAAELEPAIDARRALLAGGSADLTSMRRYPEGLALLEEAARGAPDSSELSARLELLKAVRRTEALDLSGKDPASFVRKLIYVAIAGTFEEFWALSPTPKTEAGKAELERIFQGLQRALRGKAPTLSPVATAELGVSNMQVTVDGDDAGGYRVRGQARNGEAGGFSWFLRREGGKLHLLGATPMWIGGLLEESARRLEAGDLPGARRWLAWAAEPWRGSSETEFGRDAALVVAPALADGGKDAVRLAVDALLTQQAEGASRLEPFAAEIDRAKEALQLPLWRLLAQAQLRHERFAPALATAERVLAREPQTESCWRIKATALLRLERTDALEALLEERLRTLPDDRFALSLRMSLRSNRGDLSGAMEVGRRVLDGAPTGIDFNNVAWLWALRKDPTDEALGWARKAVAITHGTNPNCLNTLATLEAQAGHPAEAMQVLLKGVGQTPDGGLHPSDWYVVGLVAEQYGLPGAALAAYRKALPAPTGAGTAVAKVAKAQPVAPPSITLLAAERVQALESPSLPRTATAPIP